MKTLWIFFLLLICIKGFSHPGVGIVKNAKGEVFYTDTERVWKIAKDGKTKKVIIPNVHTHELAIDAQGNIYGEHLWYEGDATNKWQHYVWKYSADGKLTKVIQNTEGFLNNYSFNRDEAGNMYWLERGKQESIFLKKTLQGKVEVIATIKTNDVRWQFVSKNGGFYYMDDNDLFKIENGKATAIAKDLDGLKGEDPARKPNNNTFGIWDDAAGNVYVAVASRKEVKKVTPTGQVVVVYKSVGDWTPTGGLVNNGLWVLECNTTNKVRVVSNK